MTGVNESQSWGVISSALTDNHTANDCHCAQCTFEFLTITTPQLKKKKKPIPISLLWDAKNGVL